MRRFSSAVVFTRRAFGRIEDECLRVGVETGGILVGRQVTDQGRQILVVVEATGPGSWADHGHVTYAPDHWALGQLLEQIRQSYSRYGVALDYVGEWHKHPAHLRQPSGRDLEQAQLILASPDYRLPAGEVLIPIATVANRYARLTLDVFCARSGVGGWIDYDCVVLPDTDINALLKNSLEVRPSEPRPDTSPRSGDQATQVAPANVAPAGDSQRAYQPRLLESPPGEAGEDMCL